VELFFEVGKALAKKAGTEGGNSCPNNFKDLNQFNYKYKKSGFKI